MKRVLVDWGIFIETENPLKYVTLGAAQYCGKEIELNLPLTHQQAKLLINAVVARCKKHQQTIATGTVMNVYNMSLIFKEVHSTKRSDTINWRLILPDERGKYPSDYDCNPLFKSQMRVHKLLS